MKVGFLPGWRGPLAITLAVAGAGVLGIAVLAQRPAPPAPDSTSVAARKPDDGARAAARPDTTTAEPVSVEIPAAGISSSLLPLELTGRGELEVPHEPEKAGWYIHGPRPGDPGAAVIAGHVTWDDEPAVFFELASLEPGSAVDVTRDDGSVVTFTVTRVEQYPKHAFPTEKVYGPVPGPELRLITCGGEYDEESNNFLSNVVVYARIAAT